MRHRRKRKPKPKKVIKEALTAFEKKKQKLQLLRDSDRMKKWREAVFRRDEYTCQDCKKRNCFLNAHHIKKFWDYPKLRFTLSNGISLCVACHELTFGCEELYEAKYTRIVSSKSKKKSSIKKR